MNKTQNLFAKWRIPAEHKTCHGKHHIVNQHVCIIWLCHVGSRVLVFFSDSIFPQLTTTRVTKKNYIIAAWQQNDNDICKFPWFNILSCMVAYSSIQSVVCTWYLAEISESMRTFWGFFSFVCATCYEHLEWMHPRKETVTLYCMFHLHLDSTILQFRYDAIIYGYLKSCSYE